LQLRDWTDKQGNKRRSAEVIADNVYFGDSKKDVSDSGTSAPAPVDAHSDFTEVDAEDGELPF